MGKTVVLIALTGYGQEGDRKHAIEVGFDYHLTKPLVLSELEAMIRESELATTE
jgi:CheY-like chemotaxis protein